MLLERVQTATELNCSTKYSTAKSLAKMTNATAAGAAFPFRGGDKVIAIPVLGQPEGRRSRCMF